MKILMINPPFLPKFSRSSRSPAVTKSSTIYYPLWLAHAVGLLQARGHDILFIDFPAECKNLDDYFETIQSFSPNLVVVDTSTPSIATDISVLETVKGWFSLTPLCVLVGTHASALTDECFSMSSAIDVVARGEYDWTLCDIADRPSMLHSVLGITYRESGRIIHNPNRPVAQHLDEIPFVSQVYKKHLNIKNYFYAHCRNPVISIFAGRGCPNKCVYCLYPQVMFGRRYRHRTVGHFVSELEYIIREFPEVHEVLIDDDNFTADQDFVAHICDEIISRRLSVTWTCEARVDLRYEIMVKMKTAGCRLLVTGFESGDQRILDNINKGTTLVQGKQFALNARRAGLRVHGCFMAGNRGENRATLEKTLSFALSLPLDTAQFFPLMVYPGTEAYKWATEQGYIHAQSFREWLTVDGMHNCVLNTDELTAQELVNFCDYARRQFYLRPSYLAFKTLDLLRNPQEIGRTVKAFCTLIKHLLKRH